MIVEGWAITPIAHWTMADKCISIKLGSQVDHWQVTSASMPYWIRLHMAGLMYQDLKLRELAQAVASVAEVAPTLTRDRALYSVDYGEEEILLNREGNRWRFSTWMQKPSQLKDRLIKTGNAYPTRKAALRTLTACVEDIL